MLYKWMRTIFLDCAEQQENHASTIYYSSTITTKDDNHVSMNQLLLLTCLKIVKLDAMILENVSLNISNNIELVPLCPQQSILIN